MMAIADAKKCSIFVLFLDLVKAFDRVLREMVMGWDSTLDADKVAKLKSLGASNRADEWIHQFI